MINNLKKTGMGIILVLLLVSMTGCGKSEKIENKNETKNEVKITKDFVPLTEIKEDRIDIYVIVKSMESSYWEVVLRGARQESIRNAIYMLPEAHWKQSGNYRKLIWI